MNSSKTCRQSWQKLNQAVGAACATNYRYDTIARRPLINMQMLRRCGKDQSSRHNCVCKLADATKGSSASGGSEGRRHS